MPQHLSLKATMMQHTTKGLGAEAKEKATPFVNDAPRFEEVDLFTTALIQGACNSARIETEDAPNQSTTLQGSKESIPLRP